MRGAERIERDGRVRLSMSGFTNAPTPSLSLPRLELSVGYSFARRQRCTLARLEELVRLFDVKDTREGGGYGDEVKWIRPSML